MNRAEQLRLARAIGEQAAIEGAALVSVSTLAVGQQVEFPMPETHGVDVVIPSTRSNPTIVGTIVALDQVGVMVDGVVFAVAPGDCKAVAK